MLFSILSYCAIYCNIKKRSRGIPFFDYFSIPFSISSAAASASPIIKIQLFIIKRPIS